MKLLSALERYKMNIKLVLLVLVALLGTVAFGWPLIIRGPRDFPGQRRRGSTNYGTHSFGKKGYNSRPVARLFRKQG